MDRIQSCCYHVKVAEVSCPRLEYNVGGTIYVVLASPEEVCRNELEGKYLELAVVERLNGT